MVSDTDGRTYRLYPRRMAITTSLVEAVVGVAFTIVPILHWASIIEVNGTYGFVSWEVLVLLAGLLALQIPYRYWVREPYEIRLLDDGTGTVLLKKVLYSVRN